ncbi:hypothetical protein HYZ76_00210 [Candidatus Falkowbacteria bacterium]|nr:hypothetical protein [Candidatus Falkowbacteria bacterium]
MLVRKRMGAIKKVILVTVLTALLGVIIYLLYDSFLASGVRSDSNQITIKILETAEIDTLINIDFLTKPPYTSLKQYGQLPVKVEGSGRSNPFRKLPFLLLEDEESLNEE